MAIRRRKPVKQSANFVYTLVAVMLVFTGSIIMYVTSSIAQMNEKYLASLVSVEAKVTQSKQENNYCIVNGEFVFKGETYTIRGVMVSGQKNVNDFFRIYVDPNNPEIWTTGETDGFAGSITFTIALIVFIIGILMFVYVIVKKRRENQEREINRRRILSDENWQLLQHGKNPDNNNQMK